MCFFTFALFLFSIQSENNQTQVFPPPRYHFIESFETFDTDKWIPSTSSKTGSPDMRYTGKFSLQESGLLMETPLSHHGLSSRLETPFDFSTTDALYFQFESHCQVKPDCGGSYIKLISSNDPLNQLDDSTSFSIMFGPDTCGGVSKLHFIINFPNPVSGKMEEKVCKEISSFTIDERRHLYRLELLSSGAFTISVDNKVVYKGSLLTDMRPSINPDEFIPDPTATKPLDWDEREEVVDETVVKPDDWDEGGERMIPDMDAVKPSDWNDSEPLMVPDYSVDQPEDWDTDLDGDWEPPLMENPKCVNKNCGEWIRPYKPNPNYKGPWKPTYKKNPNYMGVWAPPNVSNPDYFYEAYPFRKLSPITAVAFELWTVEANVLFDNIILTSDSNSLLNWTAQTFVVPSKPVSVYLQTGAKYLSDKWPLIGCVLCGLVVFWLFLRWIRPSSTPVESSEADVVVEDEVVEQSEVESEEGLRERNTN